MNIAANKNHERILPNVSSLLRLSEHLTTVMTTSFQNPQQCPVLFNKRTFALSTNEPLADTDSSPKFYPKPHPLWNPNAKQKLICPDVEPPSSFTRHPTCHRVVGPAICTDVQWRHQPILNTPSLQFHTGTNILRRRSLDSTSRQRLITHYQFSDQRYDPSFIQCFGSSPYAHKWMSQRR